MLALPKKRPLFVEDDGGGGFWICDACIEVSAAAYVHSKGRWCLPWARETGAYCMCDAC